LANLLAIKAIPPPIIELLVKLQNELGMDEIGKSISDIARIIVVNRQVQEIYV
jgi:hypothetical protein